MYYIFSLKVKVTDGQRSTAFDDHARVACTQLGARRCTSSSYIGLMDVVQRQQLKAQSLPGIGVLPTVPTIAHRVRERLCDDLLQAVPAEPPGEP